MIEKRPIIFFSSIAAFLLLLLLVGALFGAKDDEADTLTWDRVSRGKIRETVSVIGEIQPRKRVHIGTSIAAEIKRICVSDGQMVKAGDLLVVLDNVRVLQQLAQGQAFLEASVQEANRLEMVLAKSRDTFQRQQSLHREGLVAEEDFRLAKLSLDSAEIMVKSAKANVLQNKANVGVMQDGVGKCEIRAPIHGRVTGLKAEQGEIAIPGTSNLPGATLMIVSDMSELVCEVNISEGEVVRVKLAQQANVTVDSFPGKNFTGKVIERSTMSERSGSSANLYRVKILLDQNKEGVSSLLPGMSARCTILTNEAPDTLRVPLQAVIEREESEESAERKGSFIPEKRLVVMRLRGKRAEEVSVVTGLANTQYIQIKEGLKEGDGIVTGPLRKLKALKKMSSVKLRANPESEQDPNRKSPKQGDMGTRP
jgi:HlyD family secretion protein